MSITVLGVICIILGVLAMMAPSFTGLSIVMILGMLVLIGGILRIIWVLRAGSSRKGIAKLVIGGLTVLCGIILISDPLFASGLLTILLAVYFILDGISELILGIQIGTQSGGGWLFFAGIVSVLLGIMIWRQFPLSGAWALGILLGIKLFLVGLVMVTGGPALYSAKKA